MKKTTLAVFLSAVMLLSSCGSEDDGSGGEFYAVISSNPENLDPQLADDKASFYVIRNIYATLVDLDNDGNVVCGSAESYSVSEDGLEYTFHLREGMVWKGMGSDKAVPLTAYDYEYAFRRIYSADTMSPHVKLFSAIKNSMKLYNGVSSADFGVKAEDDYTLTINLEAPDCDFLKLLSHPAASPCNEELFLSTQGRYGLSTVDTYGCSAFYLTDWNYDPYWHENHITLEPIRSNSFDDYRTFPEKINIGITSDKDEYESTEGINIDCYIINSESEYSKDVQKKYDIRTISDAVSFIFFSPSTPIFSDERARKAIYLAAERAMISDNLSADAVDASLYVPDAYTISGTNFRSLFPDEAKVKRKDGCRELWEAFKEDNPFLELNSYNLLVSDSYSSEALPYALISCFENDLEFYCMPYFADEREFRRKVADGDYEICIDTVYGSINKIDAFFEAMNERMGQNDRVLNGKLRSLARSADIREKSQNACDIEKYLSEQYYAVPLSYEKKYCLTLSEDKDIWYDPFLDVVYFKYAKKF